MLAITEALVSTYSGYGEGLERGRKHALQAIQLLASSSQFDRAIELFFDLVERFCAHRRSQSRSPGGMAISKDAFGLRTMQNYDQTLVKLLSKRWHATGATQWDISRPQARIHALRQMYDEVDTDSMSILSGFKRRRRRVTPCILFFESSRMLRAIKKSRGDERMTVKSFRGFRSRKLTRLFVHVSGRWHVDRPGSSSSLEQDFPALRSDGPRLLKIGRADDDTTGEKRRSKVVDVLVQDEHCQTRIMYAFEHDSGHEKCEDDQSFFDSPTLGRDEAFVVATQSPEPELRSSDTFTVSLDSVEEEEFDDWGSLTYAV